MGIEAQTVALLRGPIGPLMMAAKEHADRLEKTFDLLRTARDLLASGRAGDAFDILDATLAGKEQGC